MNKEKEFDPSKPVETVGGEAAGIDHTDGMGDYPLLGWRMSNGKKMGASWNTQGKLGTRRSPFDLVNIAEPTTIKGWLETLPDGYRERALFNFEHHRGAHKATYAKSLREAVGEAFEWSDTKEGSSFWCSLYDGDFPPLPKSTEEDRIAARIEKLTESVPEDHVIPGRGGEFLTDGFFSGYYAFIDQDDVWDSGGVISGHFKHQLFAVPKTSHVARLNNIGIYDKTGISDPPNGWGAYEDKGRIKTKKGDLFWDGAWLESDDDFETFEFYTLTPKKPERIPCTLETFPAWAVWMRAKGKNQRYSIISIKEKGIRIFSGKHQLEISYDELSERAEIAGVDGIWHPASQEVSNV